MQKRFLALARVSSREQEREGFSLDVQVEALQRHAQRQGGEIVKLYRIAETASKREERKTFKDMLAYAREKAKDLDGLLFYKVDRAARNLFDYVELERLEAECGLAVAYVAQPTENSPAGRMQRRILANMASFYTEQQSIDVKEGMARRVQSGLFAGVAPYGYRNVRVNGRGLVEVHPEEAPKVKRIFELYAYHGHTLDSLSKKLQEEGLAYSPSRADFPRSKLHCILRDRAYLGEVNYRGQWYAGTHPPIVDRNTFHRVQVLMGVKTYHAYESVYGSGMMVCAHCGRPVVAEVKTKKTRAGEREYRYYRCAAYSKGEHPRVRVTEAEIDAQVKAMFSRLLVADERIRRLIVKGLRALALDAQNEGTARAGELHRELMEVRKQQDRLLSLRLVEEIDAGTFAAKGTELRDRAEALKLQAEGQDRGRAENAELAIKAFELAQALQEKWVTADIPEKRRLMEIVCLNFSLDGASLSATMRKPFDVIAKGLLVQGGRGDPRRPLQHNQVLPAVEHFSAQEFRRETSAPAP